jgi:peptidoglycan-associated lipoprotein
MKTRYMACLAITALSVLWTGCAKKVASQTPTPPVPISTSAPSTTARSTPQQSAPQQPAERATGTQSRMPDAATRARIQDLLNRIQDAYFDYNKHTLRPDAETALRSDAQTLSEIVRQYPDFKLTVEGHCDERGSEEYNMALGDARAKQTQEYLSSMGLPGDQLRTISYGKEHPVCNDHDEDCWQKNRRAHLTQAQ